MGMDGNGNDSMGVGREWEHESYSRTPLDHCVINVAWGPYTSPSIKMTIVRSQASDSSLD